MAVDKKIVLITGAAAGIGLEAVKAIVGSQQASYEIILSARKLAQAQAAAEEIARALPSATSTTTPLEIDVSSDKSIEDAAELIKSRYGRIDVLVNNAGITPPTHHKLIPSLLLANELQKVCFPTFPLLVASFPFARPGPRPGTSTSPVPTS